MKIRRYSSAHVWVDVVRETQLTLPAVLCGAGMAVLIEVPRWIAGGMVAVGFLATLAKVLAEDLAARVESKEEYWARVRSSPAPECSPEDRS